MRRLRQLGELKEWFVRDLLVNGVIMGVLVPSRYRWLLLRAVGCEVAESTWGPNTIVGGRRLTVARGAYIGPRCFIDTSARVQIGRCSLAHEVMIVTSSHDIGPADHRAGAPVSASVVVDDGAWLGARVTVLPGVRIGPGAVVAAGSLVTRDVPANHLVAGVPARMVRELD